VPAAFFPRGFGDGPKAVLRSCAFREVRKVAAIRVERGGFACTCRVRYRLMSLFQETFSIILHFPAVSRRSACRRNRSVRLACAFRARGYGPRRNLAWNLIRDECWIRPGRRPAAEINDDELFIDIG